MNRESENQDMLPEYDFSGGERGRYAARFREDREELLKSAVVLDEQAWIAHSLRTVQDFESHLVAYWALALHHDADSAGKAVTSLLHSTDKRLLRQLQKDLDKFTSVNEDFYSDLLQLIEDRNWLVHRSFRSFSPSRVHSLAERSLHLTRLLSELLLERCGQEGMQETEIRDRAEEVMEEWAADRDAA